MSAAELAVIRTAAAGVLADYQRVAGAADVRARSLWAAGLASVLGRVLAELDRACGSRPTSWVAPDGSAVLCREDMLTALGALSEAQDFTTTANRVRYAALSYRLGDDR